MWCSKQKSLAMFAVAAVALSLAGCGDGTPVDPEPMLVNASIVRVVNRLGGPVVFVYARPCGTSDWGEDLFRTDHPIEGTIQPGGSKDFMVEAGCYDLRARHLESSESGPLLEKMIHNQAASPVTPLIWTLEEGPVDPS